MFEQNTFVESQMIAQIAFNPKSVKKGFAA